MLGAPWILSIGLGAAGPCPGPGSPYDTLAHPSIHDSPAVPGRPRFTWIVEPASSSGLAGASYRVERDGVELSRFDLPWALRELVVRPDGVALGFARAQARPELFSVLALTVDPLGGVSLLDERIGVGTRRARWHPEEGYLAVELQPDGADERFWLAFEPGLASRSLPKVEDEAAGWFAETVVPPRRIAPGPELRAVELIELTAFPIDIDIELEPLRREWGSIPEAWALPSGRLALRESCGGTLVVCDPGGRVQFAMQVPPNAHGIGPRVVHPFERQSGELLLETSFNDERGWPAASPSGTAGWVDAPVEPDDGRTWNALLERDGPELRIDPESSPEPERAAWLLTGAVSKHADGTWIEQTRQAFAPDGSSILLDLRYRTWPGPVVSFFDADDRLLSTRTVPSRIDPSGGCFWSGSWLAVQFRRPAPPSDGAENDFGPRAVHLISRAGPVLYADLPGDLAGFTPDGGALVMVTSEPWTVHHLALP